MSLQSGSAGAWLDPSADRNGGQIYIDGFTGGIGRLSLPIREIRINQNPSRRNMTDGFWPH